MSIEQLESAAIQRGIDYTAIEDENPLVVRTRMAKAFPISQSSMFEAFSDPEAHVGLFQIIVGSTPPIRQGVEGLLADNEFFAFEHVQESNLPPRLMLVRYTLSPPNMIVKDAFTAPFNAEEEVADRKKGKVILSFDGISETETRFTAESMFHAETGSVFARGFIDRVWLNFFERMMFANGQLAEGDFLT